MNRGKRFFALLLSLALLAAPVLPALAADDSFSINTVEDFMEFSRLCTRDTWSVGKTVELNADLDLSGVSDFVPIPSSRVLSTETDTPSQAFPFPKRAQRRVYSVPSPKAPWWNMSQSMEPWRPKEPPAPSGF